MLERHTFYFIDTNVWLYASGDDAHLQAPCLTFLDAIRRAESFSATSVGVLEEVWFLAYRQRRDVRLVQDLLHQIEASVGFLLPVTLADYHLAMNLFGRIRLPLAGTNDYLHVACMLNNGVRFMVSSDPDFDRFHGIRRLDPLTTRFPASL